MGLLCAVFWALFIKCAAICGAATPGFRCEGCGHKSSSCRNLLPFISAGVVHDSSQGHTSDTLSGELCEASHCYCDLCAIFQNTSINSQCTWNGYCINWSFCVFSSQKQKGGQEDQVIMSIGGCGQYQTHLCCLCGVSHA
jgi:hypothetical protein